MRLVLGVVKEEETKQPMGTVTEVGDGDSCERRGSGFPA